MIAEILAHRFYIDDFTSDAQTVEEGFNIYQKAKQLTQLGGFNLCKWKTNSKTLQQKINLTEGETFKTSEVKILGIRWDTEQDEFQKEIT